MTTTNEKRTTTTTTGISSSSTTTHAHAREVEINVSVQSIRELYADAIGGSMSQICENSLREDLRKGTPYIFYHYALLETAFAPRPSWRYALAIVRRLVMQKVNPADIELTISLMN